MNSADKIPDSNMSSPDKVEIGDIIEMCCGSLRRYQILAFLLIFLVNYSLSIHEISITIIGPPIKFNCSDPAFDRCSEDCPSHVYDKSIFSRTITMEWDLVCEKETLVELTQSTLMFGVLIGNLCFGIFSDAYGRRPAMLIAVLMEMVAGTAVPFSTYYPVFCILRFLVAAAAGGTLCTGFCLVVEIIGRKHRASFGLLFQMTYYLGHASLGFIGYNFRDWRHATMIIALPVYFLFIYFWLLPESPRWLLSVGKKEEAIAFLEMAARFNKMPTENIRNIVMTRMGNFTPVKEDFRDLFRTPNIRMKSICICINWLVEGLSFFGIAVYMGQIGGYIFLNIALSGLVQIPGNLILLYTIGKCGRKCSMITNLLICSAACFTLLVIPAEPSWITTVVGCIGMMGISLSFATIFLWSSEIFATQVRNVGLGASAMCAKITSIIAPFIQAGGKNYPSLPPIVYGIAPLIATMAALRLPETLSRPMPDTIADAEKFDKDTPMATTDSSSDIL